MTSDIVIRAEGLGKKYIIGHQSAEQASTLRDVIVRSASNWARSLRDMAKGAANVAGDEVEEFWALKDVSFEIRRGEVVGVIGRNGAGKSTLLKVLSRISEPSEGRVEIKGRIASLLEVGTGFHPELTGRENVYLNGAILGMGQAEIKRKFDEIVAFAEIEKFLDTPVKRYSSGMYVRLAFAVAAHLEPEILIVDEVLAVGDAEFQRKCLGKMQDVAGAGRTVLFVSHNISAIRALCRRGLYLVAGRVASTGSAADVADLYMSHQTGVVEAKARNPLVYTNLEPPKRGGPWVSGVEVVTSSGNDVQEYGTPLKIIIAGSHPSPINSPTVSIEIHNDRGEHILHTFMDTSETFGSKTTQTTWICEIPFLRLNVGHYCVAVNFSGPPRTEHYETVERACFFEVVRTSDFNPWGWRPSVCAYFEDASWSVARERQLIELSERK